MELKTFYDLVEMINEHDTESMLPLFTDDHVLSDAYGNIYAGKETVKNVWNSWFAVCPDLKLEVRDIFKKPTSIAAFGFASGTFRRSPTTKLYHRYPGSFKGIFRDGKIRSWQMIGDSLLGFQVNRLPETFREFGKLTIVRRG